jgi:hypothetical protein
MSEINTNIPNVYLSDLEKLINKIRQVVKDENAEVSFELVIASLFPTSWQNIQKALSDQYTRGYIQGRLDKEKDDFFENFLLELYPNGVTIGENEINQLVEFTQNFLLKDKESKHLYSEWDKQHIHSYVYFKIDDKVYPAYHSSHFGIVKDICCDYFKGFDTIDIDYLRKFILENFEILSDFTSPKSVADDARYIANCICLRSDAE